jgi:hypothetical protein
VRSSLPGRKATGSQQLAQWRNEVIDDFWSPATAQAFAARMSKIEAYACLLYLLAELERLTERDVIDWSADSSRAAQRRLVGVANAVHQAAQNRHR